MFFAQASSSSSFLFFFFHFVLTSLLVNPLTLTSTSRAHSSISHKAIQSRHHYDPPTHTAFPISVPIQNKRKSFQDNSSLITANRELAFRQLTEQLWAAGLPSSTTACSMSTRSRRSSAPPSERGGEDDTTKSTGTEIVDWDDADLPDSGNHTRFFSFIALLTLVLLI